MSLTNLSNCLARLGGREKAFAAIEEAITIYRELAARWPEAYGSNLEQALQVVTWLARREDVRRLNAGFAPVVRAIASDCWMRAPVGP
jgi:hypothetical protein